MLALTIMSKDITHNKVFPNCIIENINILSKSLFPWSFDNILNLCTAVKSHSQCLRNCITNVATQAANSSMGDSSQNPMFGSDSSPLRILVSHVPSSLIAWPWLNSHPMVEFEKLYGLTDMISGLVALLYVDTINVEML